jgi:hypothetical protein
MEAKWTREERCTINFALGNHGREVVFEMFDCPEICSFFLRSARFVRLRKIKLASSAIAQEVTSLEDGFVSL